MLVWVVVGLGLWLLAGSTYWLLVDAETRRELRASDDRETADRCDIEDLEWLMYGNYEGEYPTPTMPLTHNGNLAYDDER